MITYFCRLKKIVLEKEQKLKQLAATFAAILLSDTLLGVLLRCHIPSLVTFMWYLLVHIIQA